MSDCNKIIKEIQELLKIGNTYFRTDMDYISTRERITKALRWSPYESCIELKNFLIEHPEIKKLANTFDISEMDQYAKANKNEFAALIQKIISIGNNMSIIEKNILQKKVLDIFVLLDNFR